MRKLGSFLKIVVGLYILIGSFGLALASDFKLPNYQYEKSKEPIWLVDKLPLKGDLTISFDFSLGKDFSAESSSQYQGLFQTSEGNTGVRLEIDTKGQTWNLIIGDITGKYTSYNLGKLPEIGVLTKVKIQIVNQSVDAKDSLTVLINDKKTVYDNLNLSDFITNKVNIGYGYSVDRKFHGSISNFIIRR